MIDSGIKKRPIRDILEYSDSCQDQTPLRWSPLRRPALSFFCLRRRDAPPVSVSYASLILTNSFGSPPLSGWAAKDNFRKALLASFEHVDWLIPSSLKSATLGNSASGGGASASAPRGRGTMRQASGRARASAARCSSGRGGGNRRLSCS